MARVALGTLVLGLLLSILDRIATAPALLWWIFAAAVATSVFYYIGRLVGFVRDRLLWRLRRRLIVTYVFIAVIPIFLILLLFWIPGVNEVLVQKPVLFLMTWILRLAGVPGV